MKVNENQLNQQKIEHLEKMNIVDEDEEEEVDDICLHVVGGLTMVDGGGVEPGVGVTVSGRLPWRSLRRWGQM